MSITSTDPLIKNWIEKGLKWKFVWAPVYASFTIPANGQVQIPAGDFVYTAPEGILLTFAGIFDSPHCGIRMNNPQLDTLDSFTVNTIGVLGTYGNPWFVTSNMPPRSVDGTYLILQYKSWPWTETCELYVINTDSSPHTCLGFGYTMALLLQERPPDSSETALLAMLANNLYPVEAELRKMFPRSKVDQWIAEGKRSKIFEPRYKLEET